MRKSRPLIICGDDDPHVTSVCSFLEKNGVKPFFLNTGRLIQEPVTFGSYVDSKIGNIDLDLVTSIWFRRTFPAVMPTTMEQRWRDWGQQEFFQACSALWSSLCVPCIDPPFLTKRAALKGYQLNLASQISGFKVPDYIITSDRHVAKSFVNEACDGDAVVKPLGRPVAQDEQGGVNFFTEGVSRLSDDDLSGLNFAPCIFQRRVHAIREYRVTIVDGQIFAGSFDRSNVDHVDYRKIDPYNLEHKAEVLDNDTATACLELVDILGLRYSAIDLLQDKTGQLFFLEINPVGQWLWIEELTGLQISAALAEALC